MNKNRKNINSIIDIIGWTSVLIFISAYLLLVLKIVNSDSAIYHLVNLLGAVGLVFFGWQKKSKHLVFLNSFWILIAVVGLVIIYFGGSYGI